jgi:hypothetical protein
MTRMRRRLFTSLSALALALCAIFSFWWVGSFTEFDDLGWRTPSPDGMTRVHAIHTLRGNAAIVIYSLPTGSFISGDAPYHLYYASMVPPERYQLTGTTSFGFGHGSSRHDPIGWTGLNDLPVSNAKWSITKYEGSYYRFPMWPAPVLSAILSAIWIRRWLQRRRRARVGACLFCGYDLRATPGRCPECGAVSNASKGNA